MSAKTQVFVAAVVEQGHRILLVRQSAGHSLEGQWTVPWGRLEDGESPLAAALREVWEEGGVRAVVQGVIGIQELPSPHAGGIALVYLCAHADGEPHSRDRETDAARYFSREELKRLDDPVEPWTHWLVQRVFARELTIIPAAPTSPLQSAGSFF